MKWDRPREGLLVTGNIWQTHARSNENAEARAGDWTRLPVLKFPFFYWSSRCLDLRYVVFAKSATWMTLWQPERKSLSKSHELCNAGKKMVLVAGYWSDWPMKLQVIGRLLVDRWRYELQRQWLTHFNPSFVGQMARYLLWVKKVAIVKIVC